jgi:nitrate/nitrite-specific signal transduction histidine kinase
VTHYIQAISRLFSLNEHRKARNLLLMPAFQLKLPLFILLLSMAFLVLGMLFGNLYFQQTYMSALATSTQPDYLQDVVARQTNEFKFLSLLLMAVYGIVVTAITAIYTHRLLGPTLPIRRHIKALRDGLYSHRVKLRKHDGLQDVADELNALASVLEKRH